MSVSLYFVKYLIQRKLTFAVVEYANLFYSAWDGIKKHTIIELFHHILYMNMLHIYDIKKLHAIIF